MEQPSMAHLELTRPPVGFDVLVAQRELQERIYAEAGLPYEPAARTEADFLASLRMNLEADASECEEIRDRLPWKEWRSDHRRRIIEGAPLLADERLEIKFELVDRLHFLLNLMIRAGFESWREVEAYYWAKNRENLDRQERGY